ncbi:MAG: hypothetical protein ACYC8S_02420 [Minisyncoccota bacterium]
MNPTNTELLQKIEELSAKVEQVYVSAEKTRKYFLWIMIGSAVLFILPLVGLLFAIPQFLSVYSSAGAVL